MGNKQSTRARENIDPNLLKPTGLYPNCECALAYIIESQEANLTVHHSRRPGDERLLRRLILDRKLAPCHVGLEENCGEREECPICMLVSGASPSPQPLFCQE